MVNLKKSDKIAILRGGISDEQEISKLTADQVFETLTKKYQTKIINVDEDCMKLISDLKRFQPNKIFNCLHGFFGEDGQIQSILNYLKIPYTHSGVLSSSVAMNKIISKLIYESIGIRCPKTIKLGIEKRIKKFPVIIKPTCGGSSNGLRKIKNLEEFEACQKTESSVEIVDIKYLFPLDFDLIKESVKKTNRLIIVHEDNINNGFGAEIAARVADKCFEYLDAPIKRVASKDFPIAYSSVLENEILVQTDWIVEAIDEISKY